MTAGANGSTSLVFSSQEIGSESGGSPRRRAIILAVALIVPRVVRLAWPEVWLEDTDYVHAGLLLSRGFLPFQDFPAPHFPLLEWFLGGLYLVVGPSLRAAEICTQVATALTAFFLCRAVERWRGFAAGVMAAILYGCSSLLFRYHLFEREVFTNLLFVVGVFLLAGAEHITWRRTACLIFLGGIAALIKLTALLEWSALILFLVLFRREWKKAFVLVAGVLLVILVAATGGAAIFGDTFVAQLFLFHFFKGRLGSLGSNVRVLRLCLDVTGIFGTAGVLIMWVGKKTGGIRRLREEAGLLTLILLVPVLFYLLFSPTFWPHNVIPLLIPLTWLGSVFLVWFWGVLVVFLRRGERRALFQWSASLGLLCVGVLVFPLRNDHWRMGSVFGFGFQDRGEIAEIARAVRENAQPQERVIAPPYVAVEADRIKLVHYREVAGAVRMIDEAMRAGALADLRERLKDADFFAHLFDSSQVVGEEMADAVLRHVVPVVVPDSRFALVSETRMRESFLREHGYQQVLNTQHYSVWVVSADERTSPTR